MKILYLVRLSLAVLVPPAFTCSIYCSARRISQLNPNNRTTRRELTRLDAVSLFFIAHKKRHIPKGKPFRG